MDWATPGLPAEKIARFWSGATWGYWPAAPSRPRIADRTGRVNSRAGCRTAGREGRGASVILERLHEKQVAGLGEKHSERGASYVVGVLLLPLNGGLGFFFLGKTVRSPSIWWAFTASG